MFAGVASRLSSVLPTTSRMRLGRIKRRWRVGQSLEPISRCFGLDRGVPIDRAYIERFLHKHECDVRGDVLEVSDNAYTRRFGGERVSTSHVLSIDPANPDATIIADLTESNGLPEGLMDCVILTQTLQFIFDTQAAIRSVHRMLKPGGVLLATVPGISQIARYDMDHWGEYWRFTTLSLQRLLMSCFTSQHIDVKAHGNPRVASALLYGLPVSDLTKAELDSDDRDYELLITARAVKS